MSTPRAGRAAPVDTLAGAPVLITGGLGFIGSTLAMGWSTSTPA